MSFGHGSCSAASEVFVEHMNLGSNRSKSRGSPTWPDRLSPPSPTDPGVGVQRSFQSPRPNRIAPLATSFGYLQSTATRRRATVLQQRCLL